MKTKYIIGIFLILAIATTACVYAAEATLADTYKFTVPDGYELTDEGSDYVILNNDSEHGLRISETSALVSEDQAVSTYESQGFDVKEHKVINENGDDILFVHYIDDGSHLYVYGWEAEEGSYIIGVHCYPESEPDTDWADSPIKEIHDSITKI